MAQMMVAGMGGCIMVDFGENDNTPEEAEKSEAPASKAR